MLFIVIIILISISVIIVQFITNINTKMAFWAMVFTLILSICNINLSFTLYSNLRSNPGLQGERGDRGDTGPSGSNGSCIIQPTCGIINCSNFLQTEISRSDPSYKIIIEKQKTGTFLTSKEKQIIRSVGGLVDLLLPRCEKGATKKELIELIHKVL